MAVPFLELDREARGCSADATPCILGICAHAARAPLLRRRLAALERGIAEWTRAAEFRAGLRRVLRALPPPRRHRWERALQQQWAACLDGMRDALRGRAALARDVRALRRRRRRVPGEWS